MKAHSYKVRTFNEYGIHDVRWVAADSSTEAEDLAMEDPWVTGAEVIGQDDDHCEKFWDRHFESLEKAISPFRMTFQERTT